MAEETIDDVRRQLRKAIEDRDEAISARDEANSEAKERRLANKQFKADIDDLRRDKDAVAAERDGLKAKADAPPAGKDKRIAELETEIRKRDHLAEWKDAIGDQLQGKATVEKVWREIDYVPGESVPTREEIDELVGKARDVADYLFKPAGEKPADDPGGSTVPAKPPLSVAIGAGRGAPDKARSMLRIRKGDIQDPAFTLNPVNAKAIDEARQGGFLEIVD